MRISVVFTYAAVLLSGFVQAHPVNDDGFMELVDRTSSGSVLLPAHELAVRGLTDLEPYDQHLAKRRTKRWAKGSISCPGPFKPGPTAGVKKAIKHLRAKKGRPTLAGKKKYPTCWNMCTKEGTQISWCNQSKKRKTLQSWRSVAEGVEAMLEQPKCNRKVKGKKMTGGGIHHPTKWYVVIGTCKP